MEAITRLASEKGVLIFSKSSCCMCYAVKILFNELGVNPIVHELDQNPQGKEMEKALTRLGCNPALPAVFIGGTLIGSTNEVMSLHISGSLVPLTLERLFIGKKRSRGSNFLFAKLLVNEDFTGLGLTSEVISPTRYNLFLRNVPQDAVYDTEPRLSQIILNPPSWSMLVKTLILGDHGVFENVIYLIYKHMSSKFMVVAWGLVKLDFTLASVYLCYYAWDDNDKKFQLEFRRGFNGYNPGLKAQLKELEAEHDALEAERALAEEQFLVPKEGRGDKS